jgi:glycosyltransferase involved in cell wall biosynthesis
MRRIVYYTHPHFLELALHFTREMSRSTEFHLVLELSPGAWQRGIFEVAEQDLPEGVLPGFPLFHKHFPPGVLRYLDDVASFHIVSHRSPKSVHPRTHMVNRKVARFIRKLNPDVLHLEDVDTSMRLSFILWQLAHIPTVLNVHDPTPHSGEHNWRKDLARWLTYRNVKKFVLHNGIQREDFARSYHIEPERVAVNHLGVYQVAREWTPDCVQQDERNGLFFGRISRYKGLPTLLDAAPLVRERVPGVSFTGAGQTLANMDGVCDGHLDPSVRLLNKYVENRELAELFAQASVVALPYTDATQSGVMLNAYGFGKPVVATDVGGLPEYVRDGESGMLVPPNDPQALADALVQVLTDKVLAARLQKGVREISEGPLSWRRMADETLKTYESVLAPAAPRSFQRSLL